MINTKDYFNKYLLKTILFTIFILVSIFLYFTFKYGKVLCLNKNSLVNPRFACGSDFVIKKGEYNNLQNKLIDYLNKKFSSNEIVDVAVYFRDLESGPIMSINSREDFIPASLLKLPLAITFYSLAEESNNNILKQKLIYKSIADVPDQSFEPMSTIEKGNTYSVEELIENMIVYSNNTSAQLLFEYLINNYGNDILADVYRNLGIIDAGTNLSLKAVNAKGYASIFRQLYNASFLNVEDSQKLLSFLERSEFNSGLKSGLPNDIKIAHKFGERYFDNGEKNLHDCGVVYYPNNPYIICVMTKGFDFKKLEEVISYISKEVYNEVNSRKI